MSQLIAEGKEVPLFTTYRVGIEGAMSETLHSSVEGINATIKQAATTAQRETAVLLYQRAVERVDGLIHGHRVAYLVLDALREACAELGIECAEREAADTP